MTPEQIEMVSESWKKVLPISEKAAELFYGRLFELDPELKPMFKGDMTEQGRKLMSMINTAVNNISNVEEIIPALQGLGKRHGDYGVKDEHYDTVAAALLWTLEQGLGEDFNDELKEAWTETYTTLAGVMIEAANAVAA